ncbi:recQ-mediated genome instability protein 2-like [Denticeps clupeoides]|uniref:RecQ-mediated genome instability protein 2 n=1 Tax=Denticeps clupeoides TaxID=299321 RepID=A0A8C4AST1_9TELE|nr:recQ-mediated genome instability protein 2-like [Denticeps clupeoides]XP_028843330.1 recQ-mediated genome instability protein 2-like [Denticeps clupeoides]
MDVPGKTRSPPVKVLSSQLRDGNSSTGPHGKAECRIKRLGPGRGTPLAVSVVWMQGTIVEVQPDHNSATLLDETGHFMVVGVNRIPKGNPCLAEGKYVMVMGLVQTHSPEPVLHAVKMADLSDNAQIHRKMWKYEVEDLQQNLP